MLCVGLGGVVFAEGVPGAGHTPEFTKRENHKAGGTYRPKKSKAKPNSLSGNT
jgi:hypothetical protein